MSFPRLPLCLLAIAVTGGCASPPEYTGNPFDEPLAVRSDPASQPARYKPEPVAADHPRVLDAPARIETFDAPVEPDVQIFALGEAPTSIVSVPEPSDDDVSSHGQIGDAGGGGEAVEILQEARRVGATGDVDGQISLLEQAGSRGNTEAFYDLAKIYLTGAGVKKDPDAAVGYLNAAMGLGNSEATRVLGWLYVMGTGVGKDVSYGSMLLAKAAETSVRAQREFGMALTNQRLPHLNDMERGLDYLRTASAAGDADASRAYTTAFSPRSVPPGAAIAIDVPSAPSPRADATLQRETVQNGGLSLEERGRSVDLEAVYQYALNVSLGRIRTGGDPQFTAYCWYSVAAARGYGPAREEVKSLAGVKTLAEKQSPGRMSACIAELNASIDG